MTTDEKLIDAALTLFSSNDFRTVTTREIVKEAGVSLPTLHRNFESKENLYRQTMLASYSKYREFQNSALEGLELGSLDSVIRGAVQKLYRFIRTDPRHAQILVRGIEDGQDVFAEQQDISLEVLAPLLGWSDPIDARFRLQAAIVLVARFAAATEDELCRISQTDEWYEKTELLLIDSVSSLLVPPTS